MNESYSISQNACRKSSLEVDSSGMQDALGSIYINLPGMLYHQMRLLELYAKITPYSPNANP